jgi:hypothetical protein
VKQLGALLPGNKVTFRPISVQNAPIRAIFIRSRTGVLSDAISVLGEIDLAGGVR